MLKVGDAAPDFELKNQDGKKVKLSDYRGKKVVLFLYPAANTEGCTTQACGFRDEFPKLETHNAVVLGLSPDTPKDQLKWKLKEGLPYDLLCDPEHKVIEEWGAWGEKTLFGHNYIGVIRSHFVIDKDGKLADVQIGVSPKESVERAVQQIDAM